MNRHLAHVAIIHARNPATDARKGLDQLQGLTCFAHKSLGNT